MKKIAITLLASIYSSALFAGGLYIDKTEETTTKTYKQKQMSEVGNGEVILIQKGWGEEQKKLPPVLPPPPPPPPPPTAEQLAAEALFRQQENLRAMALINPENVSSSPIYNMSGVNFIRFALFPIHKQYPITSAEEKALKAKIKEMNDLGVNVFSSAIDSEILSFYGEDYTPIFSKTCQVKNGVSLCTIPLFNTAEFVLVTGKKKDIQRYSFKTSGVLKKNCEALKTLDEDISSFRETNSSYWGDFSAKTMLPMVPTNSTKKMFSSFANDSFTLRFDTFLLIPSDQIDVSYLSCDSRKVQWLGAGADQYFEKINLIGKKHLSAILANYANSKLPSSIVTARLPPNTLGRPMPVPSINNPPPEPIIIVAPPAGSDIVIAPKRPVGFVPPMKAIPSNRVFVPSKPNLIIQTSDGDLNIDINGEIQTGSFENKITVDSEEPVQVIKRKPNAEQSNGQKENLQSLFDNLQ